MGVKNFELVILNDDGSVKYKETFKSIRQMAIQSNIPYHNLKEILKRQNNKSTYKMSMVNQLMNKIQINILNPEFFV